MVGRIYVRDIEILSNLETELSQFSYGSTKVLGEVARGIAEAQEYLKSRKNYWNVELRKREDALSGCLSDDDKNRNCNKETMAVREAQDALKKLMSLGTRLEQAVGEYQPHANRLQQLVNSKMSKAKGDLQRSLEKYQKYLSHNRPDSSLSVSNSSQPKMEKTEAISSDVDSVPKSGITWVEWKALYEKSLHEGISLEELKRMELPISDLQEGTLVEDSSYIERIINDQGFWNAARDSWEAQNLMDAFLAYLKMKNYWRSKS